MSLFRERLLARLVDCHAISPGLAEQGDGWGVPAQWDPA
jgi:hypothetical protein